MNLQNQIKRTLSKPETLEYVSRLLKERDFSSRSELAGFLCDQLRFYDPSGRPQRGGCLKALRELEAKGCFRLPPPRIHKGAPRPRRLSAPVQEPIGVPEQAGEVRGLALIGVGEPQQMRIWNELMIEEHPLGAGPLVGRQVRYLLGSEHGWLGALGFAAAALQLADRDRWIGWDAEQRRAHLHGVVCLSRFLIRPSVQCYNLASRVLSLSLQRLAEDFEQRYGYRPWLVESFVDTTRFSGASYRAANWTRVGQTQGRGRQDRFTRRQETIEDIYVYPLEPEFRARLGLAEGAGLGPLAPAQGGEAESWAAEEFGRAAGGRAAESKTGEHCAVQGPGTGSCL